MTVTTLPRLLRRNAETMAGRPAIREKNLGIWQTSTWAQSWGQVREFASANNMNQATFSRLLQMHAASRIGEDMAIAEAKAREVQALGDAANQRVDAVKTWLKAMAPEHFAGLARVLEACPTAATIKGLEVLMARHVSQGAGSFRGGNREAPDHPAKLPDSEV